MKCTLGMSPTVDIRETKMFLKLITKRYLGKEQKEYRLRQRNMNTQDIEDTANICGIGFQLICLQMTF